jgi:hypothetical protein
MILGILDMLGVAIVTVCVLFLVILWLKRQEKMFNKYKESGGSEMSVPIPAQWIGEWW